MAVVSVSEVIPPSASDDTPGIGAGATVYNVRRTARRFAVTVNDATDGPVTVLDAPLLPTSGDAHPKDSTLIATKYSTESTASPLVYFVSVEYERRSPPGQLPTPLDDPPELRVGGVQSSFESRWDATGKPFANTAGEVFDDALNLPFTDVSISYSFNSTNFDWNMIFNYVNHVNSNPVATLGNAPAKSILLSNLSGEQRFRNGYNYWRISLELLCRNRKNRQGTIIGWQEERLNLGYQKKDQSGELVDILDKDGKPVRKPMMLNLAGTDIIQNPTANNAVFVTFDTFPTAAFQNIGLP